jgi:hypothetical protein
MKAEYVRRIERAHASFILHFQRCSYLHASANGASHGTEISVESVHPFHHLSLRRCHLQVVLHVDALDHQDITILFDFPLDLGNQPTVTSWDAARFQRATKGSRQSAARSGHHVVECGRLRFVDRRVNAVMLGHR